MTILTQIQEEIEGIYNFPSTLPIENFLIDRQRLIEWLPESQNRNVPETIILREQADQIELGVFIDPKVIGHLENLSPWRHLSLKNLESFCTAVEGVSHFLNLISRMKNSRPISHLELELQAEVDKYLLCLLVLDRQGVGRATQVLLQILFERYQIYHDLKNEEKDRYELANRLAHQFCHRLEKLRHPQNRPHLVAAARQFREKSLQEKIHLLTNH